MRNPKIIHHRDGTRTLIYTVSRLTKPWAFKGAESAIRALAGDAIRKTDKIKIKGSKS